MNRMGKQKMMVVAVGLDGDGEKRVTRGKGLCLVGGTAETHDHMQEVAIKMSEKLKRQGRTLEDIRGSKEFNDLKNDCER